MTTSSTRTMLASAAGQARRQLLRLVGYRRGQLVLAVLLGAVLGGGFMAVASNGLSAEHGGGPGYSVVGQFDQHPIDHHGRDGHDGGER
jgi:hypothetical protein